MNFYNQADDSFIEKQINRYAEDFSKLYKSSKPKGEDLGSDFQQMLKYSKDLNKAYSKMKTLNAELKEIHFDTINRLVLIAEYKDENIGAHIIRISRYSALIAEKLGLNNNEIQDILYTAPMHDIGKVGIQDSILLKPGKLTDDEFKIMKTHTVIGEKILADSKYDIIKLANVIASTHHEKWNGMGYPKGLKGDKIPLPGRIVALTDVFDALTSKRPYKDPYPVNVACEIIKKERGEHFQPELVDIFIKNIDEILKIKTEIESNEDKLIVNFNWSERDLTPHNIIGKDKKMQEIYKLIELSSQSMSNVLITGESGTGKELIATAIHSFSDRKDKPFVVVNCSALPETLLESELFGHIKGSFTGAYKDKIGKFEAANKGTIFLDEIGDISPFVQVKLLRVIQEKTIVRVGDSKEIKVDMRIITATNKDLKNLITNKKFREDLYYRLKVFQINSIPLRDHKNDIPLLCAFFIDRFNKKTGKNIQGLTEKALRLFMDYSWPGNVRELENYIEHAFVLCNKKLIDVMDLPLEIRTPGLSPELNNEDNNINVISNKKKRRNKISKTELITLLKSNNGNKSETSRQLNISRVALWKKMKKFKIEN